MNNIFVKVVTILVTLFPLLCSANTASAPSVIHYQAQLADLNGINLSGNVSLEVRIYDSATEGVPGDLNSENLLYAESYDTVRIDRGILRMEIGEGKALGRFSGFPMPFENLAQAPDLYVELSINGELIKPRQHIAYQMFALKSEYARIAENVNGNIIIKASDLDNLDASLTKDQLLIGRIPPLDVSKISGEVGANYIAKLPLSKITSGTVTDNFIGNISSASIQTGTFAANVIANIITSDNLHVESGEIYGSQAVRVPDGFIKFQCGLFLGIKGLEFPSQQCDSAFADDIYLSDDIIYNFSPYFFIAQCFAKYRHYTNQEYCVATQVDDDADQPCTASYVMICQK